MGVARPYTSAATMVGSVRGPGLVSCRASCSRASAALLMACGSVEPPHRMDARTYTGHKLGNHIAPWQGRASCKQALWEAPIMQARDT